MATGAPSSSILSPGRRFGAGRRAGWRRGCVLLIVWEEGGTKRERERGSPFLKWESRAQRKRDAHWETKRAGKKSGDIFYAREKQSEEQRGKEALSFFSVFGSFHSHDSKRIPVEITQSGGIDGVFSGKQSRGEESECARLNHASLVDHNFGDHFEPRWEMRKHSQPERAKARATLESLFF